MKMNIYIVSGIKSTKEDWLKCVTEEKKIPEPNQEIGKTIYIFVLLIWHSVIYKLDTIYEAIMKFGF